MRYRQARRVGFPHSPEWYRPGASGSRRVLLYGALAAPDDHGVPVMRACLPGLERIDPLQPGEAGEVDVVRKVKAMVLPK